MDSRNGPTSSNSLQTKLFYAALFLGSGVCSTITIQFLAYAGAADKMTLLPTTATFTGMAFVYFLGGSGEGLSEAERTPPQKIVFGLVGIDVLAHTCGMVGLVLAGSGIYQVVYSCMVLFTALFSKLILKKDVTQFQWLCLGLVAIGLATSAAGHKPTEGTRVYAGIGMTLCSTFLYALHYVMNEYTLSNAPVNPRVLCARIGIWAAALCWLYQFFYTIPNWTRLVGEPTSKTGASSTIIFLGYCFVAFNSCIHSSSFFYLFTAIGAVSTGVMQGLRAVSVFAISAILYCGWQESQCYTAYKGIATFCVVTGVAGFSVATSPRFWNMVLGKRREPALLEEMEERRDRDDN